MTRTPRGKPIAAALLAGSAALVLAVGVACAAPATSAARALAAPVATATVAEAQRALLWKVSDGDNHLYLLGSFHVLKPQDYPLPVAIDAAFADAERVAFEVSPEEMRSPDLPMKMLAAGTIDHGTPLSERLRPATYRKLQAYCAKRCAQSGLAMEQLVRFEPWMVSLMVSLVEARRLGYESGKGLDQNLIDRTLAAKKASMGLETAEQQITVLDGMSAKEQEQSLLEALDDVDGMQGRMEELHSDWRRGDADALERLMNSELKESYPQLYQRINVARNDAWVPKLRKLLDTPGTDDTLVIVGAMHLLGPDGLVAKMHASGYRVERL